MTPAGRRRKGSRVENLLVKAHEADGIKAMRVPLSGAMAGWKGDLRVGELVAEVKARANGEGFSTLNRWLGENDLLFVKQDRKQPLVVMPWGVYVRLLKAGHRAIKAVDPQATVLAGSLAPFEGEGQFRIKALDYLRGMYTAGAKGQIGRAHV